MTLFICVDNKGGLSFNKRRQSQDFVQREHMLKLVGDSFLYMNSYSAKMFNVKNVIVEDSQFEDIIDLEYCFVENENVAKIINRIDTIIMYKWNRDYPADNYFSVNGEWDLVSVEDIVGHSHNKISVECYKRRKIEK